MIILEHSRALQLLTNSSVADQFLETNPFLSSRVAPHARQGSLHCCIPSPSLIRYSATATCSSNSVPHGGLNLEPELWENSIHSKEVTDVAADVRKPFTERRSVYGTSLFKLDKPCQRGGGRGTSPPGDGWGPPASSNHGP